MLTGSSLADTLTSGTGDDTLIGGLGNDTYVVDSTSDVITELLNGGTDTVISSVTQTTLAANVENLTLAGTANLSATGNTLANLLTGNAGNNMLNGGAGADTMLGGAGDDTYVVDNALDVATEVAGEGTDTVQVAIATAGGTYTLGANVENGTLINTVAYSLLGNAFNNVLTGNAASNALSGGLGNDTLDGGAGADTLLGGAGADLLTGGSGADKFLFNLLETSVNRDTIADFAVSEDKIQFSKSAFTGFTGNTVTASMFASSTGTMSASTRLIYDNTTGVLSYDADGSGTQSQAIEVALIGVTNHAQLTASHFEIVA
jgi:Ca2+-binding RTX toxin-like protein